ncbi:glycosyltransferase, partial [Candidatus Pacearchaeota archaeon]|nr:glycosyltransferase [Candidatus Pacearchaeota archaeon]MBD3283452.1 glycosyltransferase [Candidatus Pacearchaeota archaeon]
MFEREVNPENITNADIAVVIPSYNEADSIAHPTKVASQGLLKYFPDKKAVIINTDNASPDNTEKVFLNTLTEVPKIYITTPENTPGKGWNFFNAFRKCCSLGVKAIVCVDADLISITPEWIKYMIEPVLKGYDYITPVYSRHKYDGTITNNICYPLIYGIFGKNIRQPIGGDFALSSRFAEHLLKQPIHQTTCQYGIDIFMTMNAVVGDFKIAQVGLGAKIHKPSAPKLGPMFIQVVSTAFLTITDNFEKWKKLDSIEKIPVFGIQELAPAQDLEVNRDSIKKNALDSFENSREVLKEVLNPNTMGAVEENLKSDIKINTELWV